MKYYIKQKVFSIGDRFHIYDENGNERFEVQGKFFSIGKKLRLYSMTGEELAYIHQKITLFLSQYYIARNGNDIALIKQKFRFFRHEFITEGFNWSIFGDFLSHSYTICEGNKVIAAIKKRWFAWGDTYEIDIADGVDEVNALCVVLIIDSVIDSENSAAASSS